MEQFLPHTTDLSILDELMNEGHPEDAVTLTMEDYVKLPTCKAYDENQERIAEIERLKRLKEQDEEMKKSILMLLEKETETETNGQLPISNR